MTTFDFSDLCFFFEDANEIAVSGERYKQTIEYLL